MRFPLCFSDGVAEGDSTDALRRYSGLTYVRWNWIAMGLWALTLKLAANPKFDFE